MIKKVDHLGVVVRDLDSAVKFYENVIGLKVGRLMNSDAAKMRMAFLAVGDFHFEILESTDPEGLIARYIKEKGEGLHHICLEVEDLEDTMSAMKSKGARFIDENPMPVADGRIVFLSPESTFNMLIELKQYF